MKNYNFVDFFNFNLKKTKENGGSGTPEKE